MAARKRGSTKKASARPSRAAKANPRSKAFLVDVVEQRVCCVRVDGCANASSARRKYERARDKTRFETVKPPRALKPLVEDVREEP